MRRIALLLLLALLPALAPAKTAHPEKPSKPKIKDLADTVLSNRITTKFAVLLRASNLASFLSSRGPFTLFVPTDSAFSRLKPETFDALQQPQNLEILQRIILFHVINGKMMTTRDLAPLKNVPSCEGHPLPLHLTRSGAQLVARAKILHADIRCANGFIDQVDSVIIPPGIALDKLVIAPIPVPATNLDQPPAPADTTNSSPTTNSTPEPPTPEPPTPEPPTPTNIPAPAPPSTNTIQ